MSPHAPPARKARLTVDEGLARRVSLGARRPDRAPRLSIAAGSGPTGAPTSVRGRHAARVEARPPGTCSGPATPLRACRPALGVSGAPPGSSARRPGPPPGRPKSASFCSQPLEIKQTPEIKISMDFRRPPNPGDAPGCRADDGQGANGSPLGPRRSPPAGIVFGPGDSAWLAAPFVLGPARSRPDPARAARALRPAASHRLPFTRSPMNSHKTWKNKFPKISTSSGPGRRGGITSR
jgi:hypothetical protein